MHYLESSINYELAITPQKNVLETDEVMKTEKLEKAGAVSKGWGVVGLFFLKRQSDQWEGVNILKEVAVEKQSCQSGQAFPEDYSISFL